MGAAAQAAAATETPAAAADAQKIVEVDLEKIGIINSANYTGKQQYTIDGLKCEAWDSTRAQKWSYTAEEFPEGNLGSTTTAAIRKENKCCGVSPLKNQRRRTVTGTGVFRKGASQKEMVRPSPGVTVWITEAIKERLGTGSNAKIGTTPK